MKEQPETTLLLLSAAEKFLEIIDRRVSLSMMLNLEMNQVPFRIFADGDSAVISFDSLSDAIAIASKKYEQVSLFSKLLWKIGITDYYQNRHFGYIGLKANLIWLDFHQLVRS